MTVSKTKPLAAASPARSLAVSAAVVLALGAMLVPAPARAACEIGAAAAATASVAAETATVTALGVAVSAADMATTTATSKILGKALSDMDDKYREKLKEFWDRYYEALRGQTAQLNTGRVHQSERHQSNVNATNVDDNMKMEQEAQVEAKKQYTPTNQGCQFDTAGRYMAKSSRLSGAVTAGYAKDFNKVANNDKGTKASEGNPSLQADRWNTYKTKFCDKDSNGGQGSFCSATGALVNAHILPSKTLFGKETIDLSDADTRAAVTELMYNITGYEVPNPFSGSITKREVGMWQRQQNREYIAQMDAVGALAWSVVGERAPSDTAAEIEALRNKMGVPNVSKKPSDREIRQSVIEQLWDPNYYAELIDSPSTVTQKEVYLKAYRLVLLNKLIDKTEKITNVYAIEAANLLQDYDHSRDGVYHASIKR